MMGPEYTMMLEAFMDLTRASDNDLVDGAVFIFVPAKSTAKEATILSWMPDNEKTEGMVLHDVLLALIWTLMNAGIDKDTLHEMVDFAERNVVPSSDVSSMFGDGVAN